MDVRCERCKTDYEFDDARITEAGVTVKCTTCGHVFKVKKKALVVTVPVNPDDGQVSVSPASSVSAPPAGTGSFLPSVPGATPAPKDKEWKVRQANGNVFSFKELTTLQKWIVERKVTREDEISLTGESWKRLGNIAELASFFQVVEEAQKGQQLQALQSAGALAYVPPGATPSGGYAVPSGDAPPPQLSIPGPAAYRTGPVAQPGAMSASAMPPMQASPQVNVTVHNPVAAPIAVPAPAPVPVPLVSAAAAATQDDIAAAQLKRSGTSRLLLVLLGLAVLGGGGYVGYFQYWLPQQEATDREAQGRADAERKAAEEAKAKKIAEAKAAAEEAERKKKAEEEAARAAAAADAGTTTVLAVIKGPPPPRDFDGWMTLGDRLREKEKAEAALDAYGRAGDLKPERAEPHAGRGLALMDMGQKLQAEAAFLQALRLNPRYGVALMGLAETYRNQGKNEEAKKYYEQYLDVLPSGPDAVVARQALQRLQQ
ncbi:MAG TPA: zinc-ribbon domain-containing protein [Myxococcaceae bacterium]